MYEPSRRPYVEFTADERKIHAQVLGWQGDMILASYPPRLMDRVTYGQQESKWIDKTVAVRLRREDAIWVSVEDDEYWHRTQDKQIQFRPNPWTVYGQESV